EHRDCFGVEPICKTLGVSVSAYYQRRSGQRSARAVEDERLLGRIRELHAANYYAYGYRRVGRGLRRAGAAVSGRRVRARGRPVARPDPGPARGQLLRLRLPADVEGPSSRRRAGAALPRAAADARRRGRRRGGGGEG